MLSHKPLPPRLFQQNETVYARHDLETTDRQPIQTGTRGTITKLYNHHPASGWSYDVEFENVGVGWCFEGELTTTVPMPGIQITRGMIVPPDPESSPDAIEDQQPPAVRVIRPQPLPAEGETQDAIQSAIQQTKVQPPRQTTRSKQTARTGLSRIPQSPVGELTGSITGSVWAYGYAVHEGVCIYLNFGGPRTATEAMRARLSKGEIVNLVPWDHPAVELSAGEGNTGKYTAFLQNIPEAKFMSAILIHEQMMQPNYGGKSTTFIFHLSDEQAMAQLKHHVTQLVKIPVFDDWTGYLWTAGQAAMLVRKTKVEGGLDVLAVDLDETAWTRLVTGGLNQKKIVLLP